MKREEKEDVDLLKQTIETLRKEQERLEETNHVVKKSIEIVTEKRLLAEKAKKDRKMDDYILINSQEHIPSQEELMAAGLEVPTLYTQPISNEHNSNKGRKRRASYEDEEMMNSEPLIEDNVLHITKRNRITSKKDLPIGKLLATLDKEKLIELINDLVDSNPHLKAEFEAQIKQQ
ncbi:hypothetical protein G6F52_011942 [Rhizopus delemar]|nr:hypothetical protein G6F52_011942 [Rhizopus delemar]